MLRKESYKTVIIGAGPAGMAAALELSEANQDFVVVEKSDRVGGLSKTYSILEDNLEFRTDNGPHRFFSKNPYLYEKIGGILQEHWIPVQRQTRQFIDGKFFDYPVNAMQVVRKLGFIKVTQFLAQYSFSRTKERLGLMPMRNFRDYAIANFGKGLAEFNILNYTEKIWGVPAETLDLDWARQRIKGLNLTTIAQDALRHLFSGGAKSNVKSLVDEFFYPENGTGLIYETIKKKLESDGYEIAVNSFPLRITHGGDRLTGLFMSIDGKETEIAFEELIESIHIVDFLHLLDPPPPKEVMDAAATLQYRSQVHLFITLDLETITDDQWIYFPEAEIPFARVSEMRNFSAKMSPEGKTSLFIEFFCDGNDEIYDMSAEQLFELAIPHFESFGFFTRKDVRKIYRYRGSKDYPIYSIGYVDRLSVIKDYLDCFKNLQYIGRPGRFKYTNQDHSLEMGMLAAYGIIDGKKRDLDAVGGEKDYFEKGASPSG